jgi:hypothetical protein
MFTMSRLRSVIPAAALAVAALGYAQAPAPGDPCPALHDTTQDANGRTMWCNPTMTGNHNLVWQYGGPAD